MRSGRVDSFASRPSFEAVLLALVGCAVTSLGCGHPGAGGSGQAGSTGNAGAGDTAGMSGSGGTRGAAGITGSGGTTGAAGAPGNGGTTGAAGTIGNGGTTGAAGTTGNGGTTGAAGTTGSGGTTGAAGTTGSGGTGTGGETSTNLITNGDLSNGEANWHLEGTGGLTVIDGQLCVSGGDVNSVVGWSSTAGSTLALASATSYRLSYQASSSAGDVTLHAKVGLAVAPYTSDYDSPNDPLPSASVPTTIMHTFMPAQDDPNAGLAFTLPSGIGSIVCIDNVTLTPN